MTYWRRTASQIASDNGLLPDDAKPLSEPMLSHHENCSVVLTWAHLHKSAWTKSETCVSFQRLSPSPRGQWIKWITHWGRVTHICVGNLSIIGSDNGLSPGQRQAITWINVGILLIGPLGTNFSEMLIEIHTFSFKEIHLKMSSGKWWQFCLGLNIIMGSHAVSS